MSTTPPARPHRWYSISLIVLLAITVLIRYAALDIDPPYGIISDSGTFLTDEGWYSKSALLRVRFGEWTNLHDFVWRSHSALFTMLQAGSFSLFGTSVFVMRSISVTAFAVSIVAFYGICRTVQPRNIALVSCLLVSVTLQTFAYSRMALIEPVGTMFCLLALLAWVRGRGSWWCAPLSMAIIALAPFVKVSFLFAVIALSLLNGGEAVLQWRSGDRRRPIVTVVSIVATWVFYRVMQDAAIAWAGIDGVIFKQWHVDGRVDSISSFSRLGSILKNEAKMLYNLVYATGARALMSMLAFGALFVFLKQRYSFGRVRDLSRATIALSLLLLGGAGAFGLFGYQPPRYFFFALFPLVYLTVMAAHEICGERHWRLSCLFLLFVHTAVQGEGFARWLRRTDNYSYRNCAIDLVHRMEPRSEGEPIVLMGGAASFLAMYDERVRPVAFSHEDDIEARVAHWRPRYLLCWSDHAYFVKTKCPDIVADIEPIKVYPLLQNYYGGKPHVLFEIHYR